jgi:hypothetical protein
MFPCVSKSMACFVASETLVARVSFQNVASQVISLQRVRVCAHSRADAYACVGACVAHRQCIGACIVPADSCLPSSFIGDVGFVSPLQALATAQASDDGSFVVPATSEDPTAPLGGPENDTALPGAASPEPETACGPFPSAAVLLTPIPLTVPSGSPRGASTSMVIEIASLRATGSNGGDLCQLRLQSNNSARNRGMQGFD